MSMNFSAQFRPAVAALTLLALLSASASADSSFYQRLNIETILSTRPATIYVSPNYQVTLQINGREVTGISLELSKQKLFNVTLADNHRMIFIDALTNKGGADLNLILDDEQVLPIHLQVNNVPSGTRIYTFESAGGTENADPASPAATPGEGKDGAQGSRPTSPVQATQPVTPPPALPAAPPLPSVPAGMPGTPLSVTTATASQLQRLEATDPNVKPQMTVQVISQSGVTPLKLKINLSSLNGQPLRADLSALKVNDGLQPVPYTVEKISKGRFLPMEAVIVISSPPKQLQVVWPVNSVYPLGQYLLRALVKVD